MKFIDRIDRSAGFANLRSLDLFPFISVYSRLFPAAFFVGF